MIWEMRSNQNVRWQAMQRGQRTFWFEPSGNGCRRHMPLLLGAAIRILAVAPLRRVAALRPVTPAARSHSQIICQHALNKRWKGKRMTGVISTFPAVI
jgi:hypothetical protein